MLDSGSLGSRGLNPSMQSSTPLEEHIHCNPRQGRKAEVYHEGTFSQQAPDMVAAIPTPKKRKKSLDDT